MKTMERRVHEECFHALVSKNSPGYSSRSLPHSADCANQEPDSLLRSVAPDADLRQNAAMQKTKVCCPATFSWGPPRQLRTTMTSAGLMVGANLWRVRQHGAPRLTWPPDASRRVQ